MATYTWLPSGGGDFNVASNWALDGTNPAPTAPGPNDTAEFNATTGTISGNPDFYAIFFNTDTSDLTFTGQTKLFGGDIQAHSNLAVAPASLSRAGSVLRSLQSCLAPSWSDRAPVTLGPRLPRSLRTRQ